MRPRPAVLNPLQRRRAAQGALVAGPAPAGEAPRPCGEAWVATKATGDGGWGPVSSQGQAGISPAGHWGRQSLRSWTKGPAFAFRREARGLWAEVTEGQAPCRGPGGDAARTRHGHAFGAFHTFPPPGTALRSEEAQGAAWGSLCALGVCWAFSFRRKLLHPFPLESPVLSLDVGKRWRRVRRLLFSYLPRPKTLKTRDVGRREIFGVKGREQAVHSSALSLPPGPSAPLPRPGLAGRSGSCCPPRERQG